jgi:hypothetical protein
MNDTEPRQKEAGAREKSRGRTTKRNLDWVHALGLGIFLGIVGVSLVALLISVWPAVEEVTTPPPPGAPAAAAADAEPVTMSFLGAGHLEVTAGTALLILVAVIGALGSFIHAATSFVEYVGNRRLSGNWTWWYLLRLPIGASLALILYVAFRGGLFATSATSGDVNIYGVAALAAVAGLFSKQATAKLEELFTTLFRVPEGKGDERLREGLTHDQPTVTATEPPRLATGQKTVLIVRGTGFVQTSQVRITRAATGEALEAKSTFIDSTRLSVVLEATDLAEAGKLEIAVVTPPPGGGTSDPLLVDIDAPAQNGGGETGGPTETSTTLGAETMPDPAAADPSLATPPGSETDATAELGAETPPADTETADAVPPKDEPQK